MYLVYGFELDVTKSALPYAQLLIDVIADWPDKISNLKKLVDNCGGIIFMRSFPCSTRNLCDLCKECPKLDRRNLHNFLDAVSREMKQVKFKHQLELLKIVSTYGSQLFCKRTNESCLAPHLRLKPSIN